MQEAQEPEASAQMVPMDLNKVASELAEQLREHKFKITSEKWVGVYGVYVVSLPASVRVSAVTQITAENQERTKKMDWTC